MKCHCCEMDTPEESVYCIECGVKIGYTGSTTRLETQKNYGFRDITLSGVIHYPYPIYPYYPSGIILISKESVLRERLKQIKEDTEEYHYILKEITYE